MWEERFAAVRAWLERIEASGDWSLAVAPEARRAAEQLAELRYGDDRDFAADQLVGWLFWYRCMALSENRGGENWEIAVDRFASCFIAGLTDLPEQLLVDATALAGNVVVNQIDQTLSAVDPGELDHHEDILRRVLHVLPAGHPDRGSCLFGVGHLAFARMKRTGAMADLTAAIEAFSAAVEAAAPDDPDRGLCLSTLGAALHTRFDLTGDLADLTAAIEVGRDAVTSTPVDHPNRAFVLTKLGTALHAQFERTGARADLDEALTVLQEAVDGESDDDSQRGICLFGLAQAKLSHFRHAGAMADLETAIGLARAAVQSAPDGDPDRAIYLGGLGNALLTGFEQTGISADLDEAIDMIREAVMATPPAHPDHAMHSASLAGALGRRFDNSGMMTDLDEAISLCRRAIEAAPAGDPLRPHYLNNLGSVLLAKHEQTGDRASLDEAIDIGREAVRAAPGDHPDRAMMLSGLANALRTRSEQTGGIADLNEAIDLHHASVRMIHSTHQLRAPLLYNLSEGLRLRYERTGAWADLVEAIRTGQEAVEISPADHAVRPLVLRQLASVLTRRFERTGVMADIDEAITISREAINTASAASPRRTILSSFLAYALWRRFGRTMTMADLEETIRILSAELETVPADHPQRSALLYNLGAALSHRYARTEEIAELEQAINVLRQALRSSPREPSQRAMRAAALAGALGDRFEATGTMADLDEMVVLCREAVEQTPADHPDHPFHLGMLGKARQRRFESAGVRADLDAAIEMFKAAAAASPEDHPSHAGSLGDLGWALYKRYAHGGPAADLDAAVSSLEEASRSASTSPYLRVLAASLAGPMVATADPKRAANIMEAAVRQLPEVASRRLDRDDQQFALGALTGLVGDAASLVLAGSGQEPATRALRLLEAGRGVLLSQLLEARSDLTDLRQQHPRTAERFVELRDMLDAHTDDRVPAPLPGGEADTPEERQNRFIQDRHHLARAFSAILAEIRSLDGFASFGLPPTIDELLAEATQGPIVVFNTSDHRSDALVLTGTGVATIPLPGLGHSTLLQKIDLFHQALDNAVGKDANERRNAQGLLSQTLEWLWDVATEPILEHLRYHRQPKGGWPRVWWAPGGLLGQLPIHAAGYHRDSVDDPYRRTVMDRVLSSYTPTVRALRHARQHAPAWKEGDRNLIVAMPTTPGLSDDGRLTHVPTEVAALKAHLPNAIQLTEPATGAAAPTKANALNHLRTCAIAHFACHGDSNPVNPSHSKLLLHDHADEPLTVAALAAAKLERAQLAYLSSCRTAAIDAADLIDESIHLASAFQLAGFPHVIGTLWEIEDRISAAIAGAFYTNLRDDRGALDPRRAAEALHTTIRGVRDRLPNTPSLWAAYLHSGA